MGELIAWLRIQVFLDQERAGTVEAWDDARSKLAMTGLFERVIADDAGKHDGCTADSWTGLAVARHALRLLACGYRGRPGYRPGWPAS